MPLPKIDAPVFELTLPVSGTRIKYRPFTVREEKILLIAQQQKDVSTISSSIKQVVQNCILNDVSIQQIPTLWMGEMDRLEQTEDQLENIPLALEELKDVMPDMPTEPIEVDQVPTPEQVQQIRNAIGKD